MEQGMEGERGRLEMEGVRCDVEMVVARLDVLVEAGGWSW